MTGRMDVTQLLAEDRVRALRAEAEKARLVRAVSNAGKPQEAVTCTACHPTASLAQPA